MPEYTPQTEAQIARVLAQRGSVSGYDLAGLEEADARAFLARYAADHAADGVTLEDGVLLAPAPPPPPLPLPGPAPAAPQPADAFGVPAPPPDFPPAPDGKASPWLWLLTLFFAPLGGVVAWALSKDRDPKAARAHLVASALLVVLPVCLGLAAALLLPADLRQQLADPGLAGRPAAWTASASGNPVYYYFGTAT